ncbi:MAG: sulfur carrier protein ThiS, partial [Rhizomicrobium sp.]
MGFSLQINGERRHLDRPLSVRDLLASLGLDPARIAVERNLEIVPRSSYATMLVGEGDSLEIVHFIGGGNAPPLSAPLDRPLVIAGKTYTSRLIVGTGKYKSYA